MATLVDGAHCRAASTLDDRAFGFDDLFLIHPLQPGESGG